MNPQVFGKEHLIYIAVSVLIAIGAVLLTKRYAKTEKSKDIVVKTAAGILLLIILSSRITLVFEHGDPNWLELIPDSFCSASSYVLSIALLVGKKNNNVLHFVWMIALAGGLIATFYPDFIDQHPSFMYPPTIFGMMHHTWSAIVVILVFMNGYLNLTYKKWYCTLFGFTAYLSLGAFLMCVLDYGNPFYMKDPALNGTIFTVWVIAPIYIAVYSLVLLTVELVRYRMVKSKKTEQE